MTRYFRIFGVGPVGYGATFLVWALVVLVENILNVPNLQLNPALKEFLIIIFSIDIIYLFGGSIWFLRPGNRGKKLITAGPYRFVRHPIYGALIYSGTGLAAVYFLSWGLFISVVPLGIFWSWLVIKEEELMFQIFGKEYENYILTTGQFFPKLKSANTENSTN